MKKTVMVSGGFDPIHRGHVRLLKEAKKLGSKLIVVLNNDNWLLEKKGYVFMSQKERREVLLAIKYVDKVVTTQHKKGDPNKSVCPEIKRIRPHIFANGGDRKAGNIPEYHMCERLGVKMAFNVGGGKVQSSSELYENLRTKHK